jgi:hypothetical protein
MKVSHYVNKKDYVILEIILSILSINNLNYFYNRIMKGYQDLSRGTPWISSLASSDDSWRITRSSSKHITDWASIGNWC